MPDPSNSRRHAHGVVSLVVEQGDGRFLIGMYGRSEQPVAGTLHAAQEWPTTSLMSKRADAPRLRSVAAAAFGQIDLRGEMRVGHL
jgi:hypothetical protein